MGEKRDTSTETNAPSATIFIISQHSAQLAEPATPAKRTLNLVVLLALI